MQTWMLTGGAGYIGAHVARAMISAGFDLVVLDDLSTGRAELVPQGVPLVRANVLDTSAVATAMREYGVSGVVHFAAKKAVGESVFKPLWYYRENVDGVLSLLEAASRADVVNLVYSSSAAVYGEPGSGLVSEEAALAPTSPYGETKVVGEWAIRAQAVAERAADRGLSYVLLRYFNVAGAGSPELGDTSIANLIPLVFRAISSGERPQIFGTDYDTKDGTCVRDYIHVVDLAAAHVAAVKACVSADAGSIQAVYNVGTGAGASVREVVDMVSQVVGFPLNPEEVGRRGGDPAVLVARANLIADELGWHAKYGMRDMVESAWEAWPDKP